MGTRSLTFLYENDETTPFTCIYRQFDGYPSGHGLDIASYVNSRAIVNGYSNPQTQINGMGCMAAQLIVHLKDGKREAGNIYIYPPNTSDVWEDYQYHLWQDRVEVRDYNGEVLFQGTWADFQKFCESSS